MKKYTNFHKPKSKIIFAYFAYKMHMWKINTTLYQILKNMFKYKNIYVTEAQ